MYRPSWGIGKVTNNEFTFLESNMSWAAQFSPSCFEWDIGFPVCHRSQPCWNIHNYQLCPQRTWNWCINSASQILICIESCGELVRIKTTGSTPNILIEEVWSESPNCMSNKLPGPEAIVWRLNFKWYYIIIFPLMVAFSSQTFF